MTWELVSVGAHLFPRPWRLRYRLLMTAVRMVRRTVKAPTNKRSSAHAGAVWVWQRQGVGASSVATRPYAADALGVWRMGRDVDGLRVTHQICAWSGARSLIRGCMELLGAMSWGSLLRISLEKIVSMNMIVGAQCRASACVKLCWRACTRCRLPVNRNNPRFYFLLVF